MARTSMAKPTEFKLYAPKAKKVILTGSFNNWNTRSLSAKKDSSGNWTAKVDLKPGRHEYKFIVDGNWVNDPNSKSFTSNSFGSQNCVIEVR